MRPLTHPFTAFSVAYGDCAYGVKTFESTAPTCNSAGEGLAPTGFPTYAVLGLAVGFVLLATAVLLHRSRKKDGPSNFSAV